MSIDYNTVATEHVNTVLTIDDVLIILCSHFLLLLFCHLMIVFDSPDHSSELYDV